MGVPATTGTLKQNISDLKVGDYIAVKYTAATSGTPGTFSDFGASVSVAQANEIPFTGSATPSGYLYLVKCARGLLISSSVVQHTLSWDKMNASKYIEGITVDLSGINFKIRSLTGGVAYSDENENMSLTDKGFGGWPTNNEWDKCLRNFPPDLIKEGFTIEDIFHWTQARTLIQDTPINDTASFRTGRYGEFTRNNYFTTTAAAHIGFRPCFQYNESKL